MKGKRKGKSIFRSLFVPLIIIMIVQALLFYMATVYLGVNKSLSQNAVDILSGRMNSRKNDIETLFNNKWAALDDCIAELGEQYALFEKERGKAPFAASTQNCIDFLKSSGDTLVDTLRYSKVNGIFVILNDSPAGQKPQAENGGQKYGLCIRDMDQENKYSGREDLLLERAPSSVADTFGCLLDSWWEAKYTFDDYRDGIYYYAPLLSAYENKGSSFDNAYLSDVHQISGSDPRMISYSVPLLAEDGTPYAVLGVELSVNYLSSLMPNKELYENDKGCYILALRNTDADIYEPITGTGGLYNRCFGDTNSIQYGTPEDTGGFTLTGRDGTRLYAAEAVFNIYNNNSPFESRSLVLLAVVENASLFSYLTQIKWVIFVVALLSLMLGIAALLFVSRRFAAPIKALALKAARSDQTSSDYRLEHIGINEIDRLVDSIEELNLNVSRNSTRSEFFSRMSHDMRTPMNAIISFSSKELLENADEKAKDDFLAKIHDSGIYLLGLINDVLDMTKIENNKTELHLVKIRASRLFDTSISMIEKLSQKKNIYFTTSIDILPELTVMADEQHLSQIVMNLLSNAVKFTPEGGNVDFSAKIEHGQSFCIRVSDTGIGMSDEFVKELYTPFAQENSSQEGTGLGLSITKKLVELMDGTIDCQTAKNRGTTFTVTLPLVPVSEEEADNQSQESDGSAVREHPDFSGKRVLVCEDNAINISIIKLLLERVGIEVDVAENGRIGVDMFVSAEPGTYAAILMDIRMPVMDGLEAAKAIRVSERKDGATIPIIAMTADAFTEDEQSSRSAGMNEHLSKPVDIKRLYDILSKYIA